MKDMHWKDLYIPFNHTKRLGNNQDYRAETGLNKQGLSDKVLSVEIKQKQENSADF